MRLSVVFELLLVFLFLAFAAARVIDPVKGVTNVTKENKKTTILRQGPPNRYCACTSRMCNCCRDFSLPVVPLKGPGCASIMYVQRDTMMVTMSFGDRVLSNTTISGKTPKPICMALPGGISQFCGRIYGISRKGDQFRACLGLELRALDDIEAALRVSCFKFGPKGVRLESAPPVPVETGGKDPEEEDEDDYDLDDDDDDDLIGFGVDDEDDGASSEDNEVDSDSVDYTGFSVLGEDILGTFFSDDSGSSNAKKKKPSKKTAKPQAVVSQVVVPKVSTTTRRPILPNRRRSTVRPLSSITKRPLINRTTKRPAISTKRPQILQRPSTPAIASPQLTFSSLDQSTFLPVLPTTVTKDELDKNTASKSPSTTTEVIVTTMRVATAQDQQASEKLQTFGEKVNQETTISTEEPITFIIPTQKTEVVKNEIKLPQTDLAKVEAVAAIAQQDVTSGVISTSSLTSKETEKPLEAVTIKYEEITQSMPSDSSENMEKISSVKFVPTTIVTSRPSTELADEEDLLDEITESEIARNPEFELDGIKNKVIIHQQSATTTLNNEKKKDNIIKYEKIVDKNDIEKNSQNKKDNLVVSLKKQPTRKPVKEEEEEEEEEEEDGEEDILDSVLSDDDDSDNEEAEENDDSQSQTLSNKIKNEASDDEEDIDDEDVFLDEAIETSQKVKPLKVSIKKKPASEDNDNEEQEEEEEEEDILDVLGDDDEEEESDEDDDETEKEKNKKKPTTQTATVKIRIPTTQSSVQTKKPITTTEKLSVSTAVEENLTERVTERIFMYKEPIEKVTENIIIYKEPENRIPDKIFIYKEPGSQINQNTTEKVIFYKEPVHQSVTEQFVIFKEPEERITEKPVVTLKDDIKSSEEIKDDSEEEDRVESDDENSSEEELEDDSSSEKHTLVASIIKPGFSNKYAAEHDLTENYDLDIEDSEGDGNDFEEDRKMKDSRKKPFTKSPTNKKSDVQINKPRILSLSDLIGQRKKYDRLKDDKPISTSRTHRRMNLDRLLQV